MMVQPALSSLAVKLLAPAVLTPSQEGEGAVAGCRSGCLGGTACSGLLHLCASRGWAPPWPHADLSLGRTAGAPRRLTAGVSPPEKLPLSRGSQVREGVYDGAAAGARRAPQRRREVSLTSRPIQGQGSEWSQDGAQLSVGGGISTL